MDSVLLSSPAIMIVLSLIVLSLALGVLIVRFEGDGQIKNVSDGLWWAITTVTGVGYGDFVPMSLEGRLIGSVLMTAGVVLFSLVVVILSASVIRREEKYWSKRIKKDLEVVHDKLDSLEKKIDFLIKKNK